MDNSRIVTRDEWLEARLALLAREKAFTRERDQLSQMRRDLPWVRVDKPYRFHGPDGPKTLADLFDGRHQLIVYHFMFAPDWEAGCKSCSFWADNFDGVDVHLAHRDVTLALVSAAPLDTLQAYKRRMGWRTAWVSSAGSDFNRDFQVACTAEELNSGEVYYNYARRKAFASEMPGISVFYRDDDGAVFHTYSCYARGLDMLNGAYHLLDLVPKGRDESGRGMSWLRRRDEYEDGGAPR